MISALYFSPRSLKNLTAASRDITRRSTGRSAAASSFMRASMAARSSGVNGRLNAKS